MKFSEDVVQLIKERFPDVNLDTLDQLTLDDLKAFKENVEDLRHEYSLLELSQKTAGNAAYGASANGHFYFFNPALAADITGECRNLTETMNNGFEEFFHETLWNRKDLWERFDFELDESKHDWYRKQHVWIYSDTDSSYVTYGALFEAMTPESQKKYESDEAKLNWILKFNKEFMDKQNNEWCDNIYNPRHGHNIHEFELETVSKSGIYLKKKKYLKGLVFNKGKFLLDHPKVSGTGIEIIKSTTPKLCRDILKDLMNSLMFDYKENNKDEYIILFNQKISEYRKKFYTAPLEDISQSVSIGAYKKYVINDTNSLEFMKGCPVSVHAIGRYNYLAHKNKQDNIRTYSGKIKYYNIRLGMKNEGYFGFPAGELPSWAPQMDKLTQWQKTVIDPINRFLDVMEIPKVSAGNTIQLSLF